MPRPRIRDLLTYLTSLPASTVIAVCLALPHTRTCSHRVETPFESGLWAAIFPIILIGLLPIVWRLTPPRQREGVPELWLGVTLLGLAFLVITIPVAIWLMWAYTRRRLRGEHLLAVCSATLVMLWLVCFPILLVFDTWLPAARITYGAAILQLVAMTIWTSAAAARSPQEARRPRPR